MISVIIPTYEVIKKDLLTDLKFKLEYLNNLTFIDEVIVINDSPKEKHELCDKIRLTGKVKFFSNEKNCGQAYSRNRGAKLASSDYLIFLDQDDDIEFKKSQYKWKSDVVFFKTMIKKKAKKTNYFNVFMPLVVNLFREMKYLAPFLLANARVSPGSMAIKRLSFFKIDKFPDLKSKGSDDYGLIAKCINENFSIIFSKDITFKYQIHEHQSRNHLDLKESIFEFYQSNNYELKPYILFLIKTKLMLSNNNKTRYLLKVYTKIISS